MKRGGVVSLRVDDEMVKVIKRESNGKSFAKKGNKPIVNGKKKKKNKSTQENVKNIKKRKTTKVDSCVEKLMEKIKIINSQDTKQNSDEGNDMGKHKIANILGRKNSFKHIAVTNDIRKKKRERNGEKKRERDGEKKRERDGEKKRTEKSEDLHQNEEKNSNNNNNSENITLLKSKLEEIKLKINVENNEEWLEKLDLTCSEYFYLKEANILGKNEERENYLIKYAHTTVLEGLKKLQQLRIPFNRPYDFLADMLKRDEHMEKVRKKILEEHENAEIREKSKIKRINKKFNKKSGSHKILKQNEAIEKKENIKKIDTLKKNNDLDNLNVQDFFLKHSKGDDTKTGRRKHEGKKREREIIHKGGNSSSKLKMVSSETKGTQAKGWKDDKKSDWKGDKKKKWKGDRMNSQKSNRKTRGKPVKKRMKRGKKNKKRKNFKRR
ncbi:rRNA-processing protein EBP2, putative (EBP2) [Plasmodium ovale wallikeri]|uniref:rRNA-processing protein EBP2, putative n=2 Tax=Plasmodium ovale TaxID=36330 RepID=A0A1C3KPU3_PLAOA|nr:rRNA-processing protein EBP2, putative (EBP2) [Plasmodium ovale wallikeri]SBT33331.1 rRNA-processing protein EBP2, putative (EBP2) [Plasmodium ovale wallikeri]SBT76113.1 rRNA-processing protein EBP2, putative [Plasmodium ovale]